MVNLKLNQNPVTETQLEKRKQLERSLQADILELELLEKSLNLTKDATNRITNIMNTFDGRLARLESYIMPIHTSTNIQSRTNNNLDAALSLISAYTSVVGTINYHESIVGKGLGQTDLDTYLLSIRNLKEALHQLESSKYKSSEKITQDLRGRLSKGIQELDDLFNQRLQACGDVVLESDIKDGKASFGDNLACLQLLSDVLADSLEQIGPVTAFLKVYSDNRSSFLVKCMAVQNAAAKDQEAKFGYTRDIYQKGSSLLLPYARSLIVYLQAEYTASLDVIPKQHVMNTFVNLVTAAVDGFLEICESLLSRVKRNIQRRETNDLYVLIDVYDGLAGIFLPYSTLMAHCGKKGYDIKTYLVNAASTVLTYFKDFFEEYKADPDAKKQPVLSLDGTVHEMTSTTMNALKKTYEYSDSLTTVIEVSSSIGIVFPADSVKDYVNQILSLLIVDIDNKAKTYKKPVLTALFILNNLHYVLKTIRAIRLTEIIDSQVLENIEKSIKKQLDFYRNSWMPIIEILIDTTKITDQGKIANQLTKPQKESIKEKFTKFNKDFDEVYATQKTYAIPDPELRTQVIKEVRQVLCPMYDRFYDKYTIQMEFTKNLEKYVKYNKEELNVKLDQFFDASS